MRTFSFYIEQQKKFDELELICLSWHCVFGIVTTWEHWCWSLRRFLWLFPESLSEIPEGRASVRSPAELHVLRSCQLIKTRHDATSRSHKQRTFYSWAALAVITWKNCALPCCELCWLFTVSHYESQTPPKWDLSCLHYKCRAAFEPSVDACWVKTTQRLTKCAAPASDFKIREGFSAARALLRFSQHS